MPEKSNMRTEESDNLQSESNTNIPLTEFDCNVEHDQCNESTCIVVFPGSPMIAAPVSINNVSPDCRIGGLSITISSVRTLPFTILFTILPRLSVGFGSNIQGSYCICNEIERGGHASDDGYCSIMIGICAFFSKGCAFTVGMCNKTEVLALSYSTETPFVTAHPFASIAVRIYSLLLVGIHRVVGLVLSRNSSGFRPSRSRHS